MTSGLNTDLAMFPISAPSGVAGRGQLWFDSTANEFRFIENNGGTLAAVMATPTGASLLTVNAGGADRDIVFEGVGEPHLLVLDAGDAAVSIGTATIATGAKLTVSGAVAASSFMQVGEIATPTTPGTGLGRFYAKSDGRPYFLNDSGVEFDIADTGAGGTVSGSGVAGEVAYWSGPSALTSNAAMSFDGAAFTVGDSTFVGAHATMSAGYNSVGTDSAGPYTGYAGIETVAYGAGGFAATSYLLAYQLGAAGSDLGVARAGSAQVYLDGNSDTPTGLNAVISSNAAAFVMAHGTQEWVRTTFSAGAGQTTFNSTLVDIDTVINGDTIAVVTVDAGLDSVGIGGAAVSGYRMAISGSLHVVGLGLTNAPPLSLRGAPSTVTPRYATIGTVGTEFFGFYDSGSTYGIATLRASGQIALESTGAAPTFSSGRAQIANDTSNNFYIANNAIELMRASSAGNVVWNNGNGDRNFTINGNAVANLLVADAGLNAVSIGAADPGATGAKFYVQASNGYLYLGRTDSTTFSSQYSTNASQYRHVFGHSISTAQSMVNVFSDSANGLSIATYGTAAAGNRWPAVGGIVLANKTEVLSSGLTDAAGGGLLVGTFEDSSLYLGTHDQLRARFTGNGAATPGVFFNPNLASYDFVVNGTVANLLVADAGDNRVGILTAAPASTFSVGASSQFQVNSTGNLVSVNGVTYSWPGSQGGASTVLTNNGSGTLTWTAVGTVTGTGSNNQVSVWSGASSQDGSTTFTFDGVTLGVDAAAVFNASATNNDFQIGANGIADLFFVDGANARVAIGHSAPLGILHIKQTQNGRSFSLMQNETVGTNATSEIVALSGDPLAGSPTDVSGGFASLPTTYTNALFGGTLSAGRGLLYSGGTVAVGLNVAARVGDMRFYVGGEIATGTEVVRFGATEITFNENAANRDVRFESDATPARSNLFTIDAGLGRVGINRALNAHSATLDIDNLAVVEPILILRDNGTALFTVDDGAEDRVTIAGGLLTSTKNSLYISGTLNSAAAAQVGVDLDINAGSGSANAARFGFRTSLLVGTYTGLGTTAAGYFLNQVAGTATGNLIGAANVGGIGEASVTTAGDNIGLLGVVGGSTSRNLGISGGAGTPATGEAIGVYGTAYYSTGTPAVIGGLFTLYGQTDAIGTLESAALIADNGAEDFPVIIGRHNGTNVFEVDENGELRSIRGFFGGVSTNPACNLEVSGAFAMMSSDDTVVAPSTFTINQRTHVNITAGSGSTGDLVLSDGLTDGQLLILRYAGSVGGGTITLQMTGSNMILVSNWGPTINVDSVLVLIWSAGTSNWVEISRSMK